MRPRFSGHLSLMTAQLVDSSLPETRVFWRLSLGATHSEAEDPRPFAEVLKERAKCPR